MLPAEAKNSNMPAKYWFIVVRYYFIRHPKTNARILARALPIAAQQHSKINRSRLRKPGLRKIHIKAECKVLNSASPDRCAIGVECSTIQASKAY